MLDPPTIRVQLPRPPGILPPEICIAEEPHTRLAPHALRQVPEVGFRERPVPHFFEDDAQEVLFELGGAEEGGEEAGGFHVGGCPERGGKPCGGEVGERDFVECVEPVEEDGPGGERADGVGAGNADVF